MSKPGLVYQLQVENCEKLSDQETFNKQLLVVDISDTTNLIDDLDEATVIQMEGADNPIEDTTIDNNEDPFTVIKARQITLRVFSSNEVNMSVFATGSSQRWSVNAYLNGDTAKSIFKGYLNAGDISESFMPHPRELELVCNDGLGFLKETPLTDFEGNNPTGYNTIIDYLTWLLSKTGLALNLNAVFNIMEENSRAKIRTEFHATNIFSVPNNLDDFFVVGRQFIISGTASNNRTTTVVSATPGAPGQTDVEIAETGVSEIVDATFTDLYNRHFFHGIYLNARTFEDEINTCINCYEVLQRILGEEAQVFQRNGKWWIVRIDELETGDIYIATFNSSAQILTDATPYAFDKEIGKDGYVIFFSQEGTRISLTLPHKDLKLTYRYETWKELVCNQDFSKGDFIENIDDEVIEDVSYPASSYTVDCSSKITKRNTGSPLNEETSTTEFNAFIEKIYNDTNRTYEKERFLVVRRVTDSTSTFTEFLKLTGGIQVETNDKFEINIDYRFKRTPNGQVSTVYDLPMIYLKLYADDGSIYSGYTNIIGKLLWQDESVFFVGFNIVEFDTSITDVTQWQTFTIDVPKVPKPGTVYIHLGIPTASMFDGFTSMDLHYSNLNINYYPYINGSFKQYSGQQHLVTQSVENKVKRENQVYISDSPSRSFKGALVRYNQINYVLAGRFWNAAVFPDGKPSEEFLHPYGEIQAFDVWNQIRNEMRVFDAQCQGLDSGATDVLGDPDLISLLHKFILQDTTSNTTNRRFKMLTNSIIWDKCEWRGILKEVYNIINGKDYTGHSFKYLE